MLSSPCSQVIWQWEQDRRRGPDASWQVPASGRESSGVAAKCPAVQGVLGVQHGTGVVTARTGYYGKCHPGRLLL